MFVDDGVEACTACLHKSCRVIQLLIQFHTQFQFQFQFQFGNLAIWQFGNHRACLYSTYHSSLNQPYPMLFHLSISLTNHHSINAFDLNNIPTTSFILRAQVGSAGYPVHLRRYFWHDKSTTSSTTQKEISRRK